MIEPGYLGFEEAMQIIKDRLGASGGWAQAILKEAFESDQVRYEYDRDPVYLLPEDGLIDFDQTPGAKNVGGNQWHLPDAFSKALCFYEEDFLCWFSRHHQARMPLPAPRKGNAGRKDEYPWLAYKALYFELRAEKGHFDEEDQTPDWNSKSAAAETLRRVIEKREPDSKAPSARRIEQKIDEWEAPK